MTVFETASKTWQILNISERRRAAYLLGLMIVAMAMETLSIGLIVPAMALLVHAPGATGLEQYIGSWAVNLSPSKLVMAGMGVLAGVYAIKTAFLAYQSWSQSKFIFEVQAELSERLLRIYLRQPYVFHLEHNSAQLIRNIVTEVSQYGINAVSPMLSVLAELLVLLGLTVLLLSIEPVGAAVVIVVLGAAAALFYHAIKARASAWGAQRQVHEGLRIQHLQQSLGAAKEVLLLGRADEFMQRYAHHGRLSAKVGRFQHALQLLPRLWLELLGVLGLCGLVLTMVIQGRALDSILPALALFATSAFRLIPSANRVLGAVQSLRYAGSAVSLLLNELRLEPTMTSLVSQPGRVARHPHNGAFGSELALDHVDYTYPGAARKTLREVSVTVKKGETIGIIGPSGAGKSTLIDVVIGLLLPTRGTVSVDGVDIRDDIRSWQSRIGYVPQSIYLTDDTLRSNIAFGVPPDAIEDEQVLAALNAAQLGEFVTGLPLGADTVVGERGVKLSGGQRQRIGIARALYHNPDILVLDEATSALDMATEAELMDAVGALKGLKTVVIVAHRIVTVQGCDRIYCMEKGQVVRLCTPAELLEPTFPVVESVAL